MIGGLRQDSAFFIFWIMRPSQDDAAFDTFIFPCSASSFAAGHAAVHGALDGWRLSGWAWFWVVIAAFFDIAHAATAAASRRQLTP